jgi:metal-sulfur cluster biosynthetic enzyme
MDTTDSAPLPTPSPSQGLSEDQVRTALRRVKDPELNLNIVDLGLIYEVEVTESRNVHVEMTLTSPGCPSGPEIMSEAQRVIESLEGVGSVDIELVWSPYWTPERIDPRLRAFLGG